MSIVAGSIMQKLAREALEEAFKDQVKRKRPICEPDKPILRKFLITGLSSLNPFDRAVIFWSTWGFIGLPSALASAKT